MTPVSPRLREVLSLAAEGKTDKEIAAEMQISPETVGGYWKTLRQKFGASSRTEAVAKATTQLQAREIEELRGERDQLLFEIAERLRTEQALEQANEQLEREKLRRTELLTEARREFDASRAQLVQRLEYLEVLNSFCHEMKLIPNIGEHSGSWRKTWVAESVAMLGTTVQQVLNGEVSPFNTIHPDDIVNSIEVAKKVANGQRYMLLAHRVRNAAGEYRSFLEFVTADPVEENGIGKCQMLAVDVTDYLGEFEELMKLSWPVLPLTTPG